MSAQSEINSAVNDSRERVRGMQKEYQDRFRAFRFRIESGAKEQIGVLRSKSEAELLKLLEAFPEYLDELQRQLRAEEVDVLSGMTRATFPDFVFARHTYIQRYAVKAWFRRARRAVQRQARAFNKIKPRTLEALHAAFQQSLREFVFELKSLDAELARLNSEFERRRLEAEEISKQSVSKIEENRQTLISEFGRKVVDLHQSVVKKIQSWNSRVSYRRDELRRQAAAVGITI
jgi:DNA anti-recombination protein RmuC